MDESLPYQLNNKGNIPFLRDLSKQKGTFIEKITETMHIGLLPSALGRLKTGIQDNLNNKLRKYDPQLDGILVGYDNLALLGGNGHMIPGYYHIHINIRADFYVFKPKVGGTLTGTVLKKSGSTATCLTNKVFTVFVSFQPHLKHNIQLHQEIAFTIEKVDLLSQIPFVKGVLDGNRLSSGSHSRFDGPEQTAAEPDSGLSSIDDDAPLGRNPATPAHDAADQTDTPRPRKHKKRRHPEPDGDEGGNSPRTSWHGEALEEPSPRKSKKRKRDGEDEEVSPRKSKKRHKSDAAADSPSPRKKRRHEQAIVTLEPVSEAEQELYLPDAPAPGSHRKKKRKERAEINGNAAGMVRQR